MTSGHAAPGHHPPSLATAVEALALLLEEENAHLMATQYPLAAALLDRKKACLAALTTAQACSSEFRTSNSEAVTVRTQLTRLDEAASRNKRLLERAILVQGQVVATLARAIPPPTASGYGRPAAAARTSAFALRASA